MCAPTGVCAPAGPGCRFTHTPRSGGPAAARRRSAPDSVEPAMTDQSTDGADVPDELPEELQPSAYVGPAHLPEQQPPAHPRRPVRADRAGVHRGVAGAPGRRSGPRQRGDPPGRHRAVPVRRLLVVRRLRPRCRRAGGAGGRHRRRRLPRRPRLGPARVGAGCAAGRRGGSCCSRRRIPRPGAASCWSTASTEPCSNSSSRTTPSVRATRRLSARAKRWYVRQRFSLARAAAADGERRK